MSPVRILFERALVIAGLIALTLPACTAEDAGGAGAPGGEAAAAADGLPAIDTGAENGQADAPGIPGAVALLAPKSKSGSRTPMGSGPNTRIS